MEIGLQPLSFPTFCHPVKYCINADRQAKANARSMRGLTLCFCPAEQALLSRENGRQELVQEADGSFVQYVPAPLLQQVNIVDTPGTNVILDRQQRLTEEFVPRADLVLFCLSAGEQERGWPAATGGGL